MSQTVKVASLGKRYIVKITSNALGIPLYLLLESIIPRLLGPGIYGSFNFTNVIFVQFISFLEMGSATCLSTSLTKRPQEFALVAFYFRITLAILAFMLVYAGVLFIPAFGEAILPEVPTWLIIPTAFLCFFSWLSKTVRSVADALGATISSELIKCGVSILSGTVLLLLYFGRWLNFPLFFAHQYISFLLAAFGICWLLAKKWPQRKWSLTKDESTRYSKEFWRFSGPLFTMTLVSALIASSERWLLQLFEGSVEQGYFALSQKISMGCFLVFLAMSPLLMREFAVAHSQKNSSFMAGLLDRYAPLLYAVAAWFACFTSLEASAVIRLFGGSAFADALLPVQIMALSSMHQGYGQLAGTVFYATGETRHLRNLTIAGLCVGLICAYFLLVPSEYGGLKLGAFGLAIKVVGVQIITVNIMLFVIRRTIPFNFKRNIIHQLICPLCFLSLAFLAKQITLFSGIGDQTNLIRFFCSGIIYSVFSLVAVFLIPVIAGLEPGEIKKHAKNIFHKVKGHSIS